jgi:hypothetical protein
LKMNRKEEYAPVDSVEIRDSENKTTSLSLLQLIRQQTVTVRARTRCIVVRRWKRKVNSQEMTGGSGL